MGIKFSLNAFHLKVIAMTFMLIDHVGVMIFNAALFPWAAGWYLPARILGRIAFPIFAFLVVEAVHHTRNIVRYWIRLGSMAILIATAMWLLTSQFEFVLFSGNIFIDLLVGAIFIYGLQNYQKFAALILILPLYWFMEPWLPNYLQADYGTYGWLLMTLYWLSRKGASSFNLFSLPTTLSASMLSAFILFGLHALWYIISAVSSGETAVQSFAWLAAPVIGFYNGLPGHQSRAFKIFSYGFYPLHFGLIYVILLGLMYLGL